MPQSNLDTGLLSLDSGLSATNRVWSTRVRGLVSPEALAALRLQLGDTVGRGVFVTAVASLLAQEYAVFTPLVTSVMCDFPQVLGSGSHRVRYRYPAGSTHQLAVRRVHLLRTPRRGVSEGESAIHRCSVLVCNTWHPWELRHHRKLLASWWEPTNFWVNRRYEIEEEEEESDEEPRDDGSERAREQFLRSRAQTVRTEVTQRLVLQQNKLVLAPLGNMGTFADVAYAYMRFLDQGRGKARAYKHLMTLVAPVSMPGGHLRTSTPQARLDYCAKAMNGAWW